MLRASADLGVALNQLVAIGQTEMSAAALALVRHEFAVSDAG